MGDMYYEAGREATRKVVHTTTTIHPDGTCTVTCTTCIKRTETTNTVAGTERSLATTNETAPTKKVLDIGWKQNY